VQVVVQMGESLQDIVWRYQTTVTAVAELNQLIHPTGLAAGDRLTLFSPTAPVSVTGRPHLVQTGDTLLSVAAKYGVAPLALAQANGLPFAARLFVGQRLRVPVTTAEPYWALPGGWREVRMSPNSGLPGETLFIYVNYLEEGQAQGELITPENETIPLHFLPTGNEDGEQVAVVGLDAFATPGRYGLRLGGEGRSRPWYPFAQDFYLRPADYTIQNIPLDDQPDIRAEEDAFLSQIFSQISPNRLWEGAFQMPVSPTIITARYGDARSYNNAPVSIFHTGIDFGGQNGTPIAAPAAGQVAFVGTLNLRGETVILDHGWGVYTAYYHLSEVLVQVNELVEAGQVIGLGGSTGLSTGPHLHWDVRVHNTAVNPIPWTQP
jgi:murein DD-endopeptidase MepM/ murein hydrolase activator NlpD